MNVLVIGTNQSVFPMPVMPIGARMVAEAAERAGHKVSVLDLMFEHDPPRAIASALRKSNPDVIGLSLRNIDNNDMRGPTFYIPGLLSLIQAIRSRTEVPIVLGGAAFTVMPEEILGATGVSRTVLMDGEVTFPLVLERLSRSGKRYQPHPLERPLRRRRGSGRAFGPARGVRDGRLGEQIHSRATRHDTICS
jgi:hypothetical protein